MTLLLFTILLAFIFDFINGFHDAANSIATIVSTKVLTPFQAVVWAAFFNVVAALIFDLKVADAVASIVKESEINLIVIVAGLLAAIIWNLFTWWYGIPSSSSHTLMGGFAGAAFAKAGVAGLGNVGKLYAIFGFIFLAPLIGMIIAFIISLIIIHLFKNSNPYRADAWFKKLQLVSSAAFSVGHGANDAQKVMGVIAAAVLVYTGQNYLAGEQIPGWLFIERELNVKTGQMAIKGLPNWIVYGCYAAIGLGTLSGGWKIVKTMGTRITKVTPFEGVSAETAGAITLYITHALGIPVSTTHTIAGSIIGVGALKRLSAVRWGITVNLLWAWILTIPVSALMAGLFYYLLNFLS